MEIPVTRYATNAEGDSIAFQALGEGDLDIVFVPGFISHVELFWAEPAVARFYERLAEFARLILFDKRGTGLSDPVSAALTLEDRIEDVRAVMDAVGSEQAAVIGLSEGAPMAALLAATYPDRTAALVLCGSIIGTAGDEHPAGKKWEECFRRLHAALDGWGTGSTLRLLDTLAPSQRAYGRSGPLLPGPHPGQGGHSSIYYPGAHATFTPLAPRSIPNRLTWGRGGLIPLARSSPAPPGPRRPKG